METIEEGVFRLCSGLREIVLPPQLKNIGKEAFSECHGLKEIVLPEQVEKIGVDAFADCSSLERAEIKERVRKLEGTFVGCSSLKEVQLPDTLLELGDEVFLDCSSLEKIEIPKQVEIIGKYAFYGCSSLGEMEIPDSVKVIDGGAFFGCSEMRRLRLPELTWMEPDSWDVGIDLTSLETIIVPKNTESLVKRVLENRDVFPQWEDIEIKTEEEEREENLYAYEVTEEGVVIYEYRGNENILELPEQVEGKPVVAVKGNREEHQGFVGEGVEEVILPKTLKRIESCAFEGSNVRWVSMDEKQTLEEIGKHGFKDCTQLGNIPRAEGIGAGAFEGCISLSYINLYYWGVKRIEDRAFYGCTNLSDVRLGLSLELIGSEAFKYCNNLRDVTFPSTLERIGSMAFEECRDLTYVNMNEGLTRIESRAFQNCVKLREISLPTDLKVLERGVFFGCTGLWHVELPDGLKEIEDWAFNECTSLKGIILPEEIESIGIHSFQRDERGEAYEIQIYGREGTKTWELLQDERYERKWKPWKARQDYSSEYYLKRKQDKKIKLWKGWQDYL